MRIAVGSDHAGFRLKNDLSSFLRESGHEIVDLGTYTDTRTDYPDLATAVAEQVVGGKVDRGLLVCGTGVGMAITANKLPGIRAAVVSDTFSARATREHNDANVLCLGERVVGAGLAREILAAFLEAEFEGGRHADRLRKITELEQRLNGKVTGG